jgi:3',5'-cyclic AMP phosphodiesterase CpdA
MIAWHPTLGNHEYRGNTQAVLDYTHVSRRWEMPARYYTKTYADKGMTLRVVWLDTTPLMEKYRTHPETYPDARLQDLDRQLAWADSVLTASREQWVVVLGHHPIYAQTSKDAEERDDMQRRLDPILRRHHVDLYVCGHIHNFQHIRVPGSPIDYIVNSSASLSRKVTPTEGTVYCNPEPGFSIISADANELTLRMINKEGKVLHTVSRKATKR